MAEKKEISAVEQERIDLAQKLSDWVNENPTERACVCILGSRDTATAMVVGNHKLCVESVSSAMGTKESKIRQIVMESLMLSTMVMSEE